MVLETPMATMTGDSSAPVWATADKKPASVEPRTAPPGAADRIIGGRMMFAHDAENDERGGEQRAKREELAAFGFEEIEKVARFHRLFRGERTGFTMGGLVIVMAGIAATGVGEMRVSKTVKALRNDRLLRPPSGVPVTAK